MAGDYLIFLSGVILAAGGGEFFVRGTVGLASALRVSPGIIGATVAAFATSGPELTVSVTAALTGNPRIALGDALGSNVVNVALILGIALVISGIQVSRDSLKRDFPVALLVPVITGLLLLDGTLSRIDGLLLLGLFLGWLTTAIVEARRQRGATAALRRETPWKRAVLHSLLGLVLLVTAGRLIVMGATAVAASLGMDKFVIGATIVALGTSAPELATTVIAKLRGHDDVALGAILGSNIFNGLMIVAVASIITPIAADWREIAITLSVGVLAVALVYPTGTGYLDRRRGTMLIALYSIFVVAILQSRST